ncbi:hypothetical protein, partial [Neorhizobium galegae]|uniref:hypothetical protein n=1 Tax=Neorhizobium galegae TaxID=399 RepID=UPI0021025C76
MKLVTWHEFIEMPEGTVFSDVPRNPFDAIGIRIKGETRRNNWVDDFHESDLMPKIMDVSVSDFEETKGSQIMLIHPAGWGRDRKGVGEGKRGQGREEHVGRGGVHARKQRKTG